MVRQLATHKGTGHHRFAAVFPFKHFGLLALDAFEQAQRPRQGDRVQQRGAGFEFGVQHHGAVNIADGPVRGALQDLHHAAEVKQDAEHQHTDHHYHALPAVGLPGQCAGADNSEWDEYFL